MTKARDLANLLDSNGQIDNADIADNTIASSKLSYNASPYRNIIINGDMSIAQRGTSSAGITTGSNGIVHSVDRMQLAIAVAGTWTVSQETDAPTGQGFNKSLKFLCTTNQPSIAAGGYITFMQKFEGQNLQYLKFGTANAQSLTASFWIKSSKTGNFIVELADRDNTKFIAQLVSINTANTWEKKTVTFQGNTANSINNDNGWSMDLQIWFGSGTTYTSGTLQSGWQSTQANRAAGLDLQLQDTTNANVYLTGVQLEAGTTASDFEFLPYDVNLDRCYRYYEVIAEGNQLSLFNGTAYNSTIAYGILNYTKEKRAVPTLDHTTGTAYYEILGNASSESVTGFAGGKASTKKMRLNTTNTLSRTQGHGAWFQTNNTASFLAIDAEL